MTPITDLEASPFLPLFAEGDRVSELWQGETRVGTIVHVYRGAPALLNPGVIQYAVKWDDRPQVERGYLGVGFTKVAS